MIELTTPEKAALAALAWREHWLRRIKKGAYPVQDVDIVLLESLDRIYGEVK